ncbi:penicillin-binding protein 1A [Microvirga guangxiensis]|uniref:Membrane carboxypeptidase/penicillin-binding protein n=1 Tax=Microvirga guangxiensis TaxID=549386 RepID=A0A1G5LPJ8_9HYPH|nr:transglycosylase domain-containing protein [Microvirga guangxiensis]SCZ14401.1 Membrane carboxypeptidase/penicillin-binding protein [Microvirga guangxiensis]
MSAILIKIFATALTLSQVLVDPEAVKTSFDPAHDKEEVAEILKSGCTHMRRAFDIEDINLDDLITTAMDDPQAVTGDLKILQGLSFNDLHASYRLFCKNETVEHSPVDLGEVITFYNNAVADLPDAGKLKGLKLPGVSVVLDGSGRRFAEIYEPDHRRIWVQLSDIPKSVQQAFVSAEDKRFYQHKGVDERGVIRAFVNNLANPGRPAGGSTITQQVAKNLLVGDDVTYERKMREMIVASRIERTLSKAEILEIYLNSIYLGRTSWGIEMAAQSYFGKGAKALSVSEGALLAGLAKGPNYYNPDTQPDRARERMAYVLSRMQEDSFLTAEQMQQAVAALPSRIAFQRPRRDSGFYFTDHLDRDARTLAGIDKLTSGSYTVRSTINAALQKAADAALQEGLARYEMSIGRQKFQAAEANLAEAIKVLDGKNDDAGTPAWRRALENARLPLYDVRWPAAIVIETGRDRKTGANVLRVGLSDGRVLSLNAWDAARRDLKLYDVVRVRIIEQKGKGAVRADLRVPPSVQGGAVVLENKTGRILAMVGGFSYPLSQLNRVTQAHRQPGSAFKPLTYLAALSKGLQPNTLVWDSPITLPPVNGGANARAQDYWRPKNYDGGAGGIVTLRRALENSKNLVTARLLDGGIEANPARSLQDVCELAVEAQLYLECTPHYPFVLGAQPVRILDIAAFYAAIANEGAMPVPHAFESIEERGQPLYSRKAKSLVRLGSADAAAFFQLKSMLQGVLARGTARNLKALAPYAGGKTGTSDDENDAWFVGFTNDVTVAVWVGHDNADGRRRTLGRGQTGAKVAAPIFKEIVEAAWEHHMPKSPLSPPSPQAAKQLIAMPIDLNSGDRLTDGQRGAFMEYFRLNWFGRLSETQYRLVPQDEVYAFRNPDPWSDGDESGRGAYEETPYAQGQSWLDSLRQNAPAQRRADPGWRWWWEDEPRPRPRRVDPDYPWGYQRVY